MKRLNAFTAAGITLLCVGIVAPADAQGLKDKVRGAWTLEEGSEILQDGKKVIPWGAGRLMLGTGGHFAFFVIGKDRPKGSGDPRVPVGPVVAYYGTYTINEADSTLAYTVEHATNPTFDGGVRTQKITFEGDLMTTTASPVNTPQGPITPVNRWKKAK